MANSEYWTGLWVAGVVILLCFLGLSLGVSAFVSLYDRIGAWEIWNAPFWVRWRTPLIVLGVIAFLAAAIALSHVQGQREMTAARDFAESQGWAFSRDAAPDLEAAVGEILADLKVRLYHVRTVETGRRNLHLFDCAYVRREASAKAHDSYGTACWVRSDRFGDAPAPVEILERDWSEVTQSHKVEMGRSPFAESFIVRSRDPGSARRIVGEDVQAILREHAQKPLVNPVGVTIGTGGAVVLTGRTAEPARLQDLLELACRLESVAH